MKYLKLYENFELSNEIWVIMDENEELILGDQVKLVDQELNDNTKASPSYVMIPTENANKDTFNEFSFTRDGAMKQIDIMKNVNVYIGYDHTPTFSSMWEMSYTKHIGRIGHNTWENPYKRFFTGDDLELKPVKFFQGIMKADNLNI
jgi:hypothetical protein